MPTITVTNKSFEKIAASKVGSEASKFSQLRIGRWPKCCSNSWLNHKADMMVSGTKLRYSKVHLGKVNFFSSKNGKTLANYMEKPANKMVSKT